MDNLYQLCNLFFKEAGEKEPTLTYSSMIRKLRKEKDEDKLKSFQKNFKEKFDKAYIANKEDPEKEALVYAIDQNDVKDVDLVSKERDEFNFGSNPPAFSPQQSFAPYEDPMHEHNNDEGDADDVESSDARKKILMKVLDLLNKMDKPQHRDQEDIPNVPLVGNFDESCTGTHGLGPVENIRTFAYTTPMTTDISKEDKDVAEKADKYFEHLIGVVDKAVKHFNILYEPFKNAQDVPTEETIKNRVSLREFRDQIIKNFDDAKRVALECYKVMNYFSSDTSTFDLMSAFTDQLDTLEETVNGLIKVFSNLSSKDFKAQVIKNIGAVKKESEQLNQIINDRIIHHIDTNILGRSWLADTSRHFNEEVKEHEPVLMKLYKDRQDKINKATK